MRKETRSLFVWAMALAGLTACSGGSNGGPTAIKPPTVVVPVDTQPTPVRVKVSMVTMLPQNGDSLTCGDHTYRQYDLANYTSPTAGMSVAPVRADGLQECPVPAVGDSAYVGVRIHRTLPLLTIPDSVKPFMVSSVVDDNHSFDLINSVLYMMRIQTPEKTPSNYYPVGFTLLGNVQNVKSGWFGGPNDVAHGSYGVYPNLVFKIRGGCMESVITVSSLKLTAFWTKVAGGIPLSATDTTAKMLKRTCE